MTKTYGSSSVIKRNKLLIQQYGWIFKRLFWAKEGSQIKALTVCFNLYEVLE